MIDDGHGVGEHVVELGNGRFGKKLWPFSSFSLHADEDGLALQAGYKPINTMVVRNGELQPAVRSNAVPIDLQVSNATS
jgi:hypothetical protein